jgi:hypothetical protein
MTGVQTSNLETLLPVTSMAAIPDGKSAYGSSDESAFKFVYVSFLKTPALREASYIRQRATSSRVKWTGWDQGA